MPTELADYFTHQDGLKDFTQKIPDLIAKYDKVSVSRLTHFYPFFYLFANDNFKAFI